MPRPIERSARGLERHHKGPESWRSTQYGRPPDHALSVSWHGPVGQLPQALVDVAALDGGPSSTPAGRRRERPRRRASSRPLRRLSASPALVEPRLDLAAPVGVAGFRVLSSRSRHRSGSLRTTRHQPTRVQLTTRSSAAAADHQPGLRRLCLGYPTAEPGDDAAAAVCWSDLLAGAHSRTSSPAPSSRWTLRNRQIPEDESLAPGMVAGGETTTARTHGASAT